MAWYYGTYSCGHEGRVNVIGPVKDREWKVEQRFSKMCPECYEEWLKKERERKNAEADRAAAEMELPELIGTPAQIKWANTIRVDFINHFTKHVEKIDKNKHLLQDYKDEKFSASVETNLLALDYGLKSHNDARFWIDNRLDFPEIAEDFMTAYKKSLRDVVAKDIREELNREKAQLTVKPENTSKNGIVILQKVPDNKLAVSYAKDEDFRRILKEKGFTFDWERTAWTKSITEYTGSFDDRAADIGNCLLANGFIVRFENLMQMEKAISGDYEPECDRWVKFNHSKDAFSISWKGRNDTLYFASKKLPKAKWVSGCMTVPAEYYIEVIDFANTLGFRLSEAALKRADECRALEASYLTAKVSEPAADTVSDKDRLRKSLVATGTIIEDLIDET